MKDALLFFLLCFLLLWASCAKQSSPSGGPRDEDPPKVLGAHPGNETTHFDQPEVKILFDEFIQLNKPQQNIIISPPLEDVEYQARRKELTISIPDSLQDNTTYKINFGEAIQDLNEGNPLKNFAFVFATGPVLDSLKFSGEVADAFTGKPKENVKVNLYSSLEDSTIYRQNPNYFATTNESGSFEITNIREDTFFVVAYDDANNNFRYDPDFEGIAFKDTSYYLDTSIGEVHLRFSKPLKTFPKITCTSTGPYSVLITVDRQALPKEELIYTPTANHQLKPSRDSTILYYADTTNISIKYINFRGDTFSQKCEATPAGKFSLIQKKREQAQYQVFLSGLIDTILQQPIATIDTIKDTIAVDSFWQHQLFLAAPDEASSIGFADSSILSKNGAYLSAFTIRMPRKKEKQNAGTLTLKLSGDSAFTAPKILYLYTENQTLRRYLEPTATQSKFVNLTPGSYQVKVVLDKNKNHAWDPANFAFKQQPEPVIFFPEKIDVKSNWEQTIDLDFSD